MQIIENVHLMSFSNKTFGKVRSDEAGAAGYKYVHRVCFGLANVSRNGVPQPLCKRLSLLLPRGFESVEASCDEPCTQQQKEGVGASEVALFYEAYVTMHQNEP